ncbi:MAG: SPASM domain-containing protein [Desulfovibrio sp.]|uniref:radical SAM protein n=1 Tax=Desulfovibrio sp. TaxID=885 RepID=UPI0025C09A7C|nr:radical SAM protein [Desulfovibrio sp.]MCI7569594.1 SPASM domain-containing protein [Desulfovibrio sp.]
MSIFRASRAADVPFSDFLSFEAAMQDDDTLKRLYIEPTSRCNLRCAMCFRKSWIDETAGDMSETTFQRTLAHLPESVETVFFGGMGEPLAHAHITEMVRAVAAAGRRTELLSNGSLLDGARAEALLDAGLDMLWLSVDALDDAAYGAIRCNGDLTKLREHILRFNQLRFRLDRPVRLGLAFVVMKSNARDLAKLPYFAQYYHINEVNISHVIPTDEHAAGELLYRQVVGSDLGGDSLLPASPRIHMPLMDWTQPDVAYGAAGLLSSGMCEIFLSGQRIRRPSRRCRFIDEGMAFVRHDGMVSPCMSLLRSSRLYWGGRTRVTKHHFFGNVDERPLTDIWNSPEYRDFRRRVREFEFSPCCRCSQCDNWERSLPDCYGNEAPTCGACFWSEGIISCP